MANVNVKDLALEARDGLVNDKNGDESKVKATPAEAKKIIDKAFKYLGKKMKDGEYASSEVLRFIEKAGEESKKAGQN